VLKENVSIHNICINSLKSNNINIKDDSGLKNLKHKYHELDDRSRFMKLNKHNPIYISYTVHLV
jgi:hypothetical protein